MKIKKFNEEKIIFEDSDAEIEFKLRSCINDLEYLNKETNMSNAQKEMIISIKKDLIYITTAVYYNRSIKK